MFIARSNSVTLLCSEERPSFESKRIALPLFRTEPKGDGLLAINIALLRSGGPDVPCSRSDFCKKLFSLSSSSLPTSNQL